MNKELEEKVKAKIIGLSAAAVEEAWSTIKSQMDQSAMLEAMKGNEGRFKFPVSIKAVLMPAGNECSVEVSVSFGSRARLTMDAVNVSNQPELRIK